MVKVAVLSGIAFFTNFNAARDASSRRNPEGAKERGRLVRTNDKGAACAPMPLPKRTKCLLEATIRRIGYQSQCLRLVRTRRPRSNWTPHI